MQPFFSFPPQACGAKAQGGKQRSKAAKQDGSRSMRDATPLQKGALKHAAPEHNENRELLGAVRRIECAPRLATLEHKADREIVLGAMKQNGNPVEYAAPELKADRESCSKP